MNTDTSRKPSPAAYPTVGTRPKRRASRPSVREVCLLGGPNPGRSLESGDRVTCSGRAYRVVRTRARAGEEGELDATRYVHLTSELA